MIIRINSDLPGTVTAMVTENIFDSDTGRHLLIPQGSTLVGRYDSEVTYGQSRVLLVWTQLVRENRPTIKLGQLVAHGFFNGCQGLRLTVSQGLLP